MANAPSRKPFSAERKARANGSLPHHPSEGSDVAAELLALRQEISRLRSDLKSAASAPASHASISLMAENSTDMDGEGEHIRAVQIEIAQLVKSIGRAKSEIAAIRHPKSEDDRLMAASNELDAIVEATEFATNTILESSENIEKLAANLAGLCHDDQDVVDASERIVGQVVRIMEACNFQDITGQRINKVVETVHFIEQRVLAMIDIWGVKAFEDLPIDPVKGDTDEDSLLNGPQLANKGISQADIDALFD